MTDDDNGTRSNRSVTAEDRRAEAQARLTVDELLTVTKVDDHWIVGARGELWFTNEAAARRAAEAANTQLKREHRTAVIAAHADHQRFRNQMQ